MRRMTVVVFLRFCGSAGERIELAQLRLVDTTEAIGNTPRFSQTLQTLRPQIVRVNLSWGGVLGVARERPNNGTNPEDRAYEWDHDAAVMTASARAVSVSSSRSSAPRGGRTAASHRTWRRRT